MLTVKYFAYGSNLLLRRIKDRLDTHKNFVTKGEKYTLQNYKLVFNVGYMSYANIVPSIGDSVEGVLYDITPEQFKELDRIELFYGRQYFQINSQTIGCVYIAFSETTTKEKKPDLDYLNIIIDGCYQNNIEYTYRKLVEFKLKNYKLKKSKHKWNI